MTSQEREDNAVLIAQAKELGIKSPHMCSLTTLLANVAEAKAALKDDAPKQEKKEEAPRKIAPRMKVASVGGDSRTKRVQELERANPEFKYIYMAAGTTAAQLEAKGLESTGEYLKNDLICRTMKDSFDEVLDARNTANRRLMDSIDTEGSKIKSWKSQAKEPQGA